MLGHVFFIFMFMFISMYLLFNRFIKLVENRCPTSHSPVGVTKYYQGSISGEI